MRRTWIIDVLADLRSFAQANDLPHLADELARTARIAAAELGMPQQSAATTTPDRARH